MGPREAQRGGALRHPDRRALRAQGQTARRRRRRAGRPLSGGRRRLRVRAHRQPARGNAERRLSCRGPRRAPSLARNPWEGNPCVVSPPILLACLPAAAFAANPVAQPSKLDAAWQARTKAMFKTAIEIPTVAGRGQMPKMAEFIAAELKKGGWTDGDIKILPHDGRAGDKTVSLVARWKGTGAGGKKPILILAHMDVVEAKRADWKEDPFAVHREGRLFLRPRDERRQAGRDRHHRGADQAARGRVQADPRPHPLSSPATRKPRAMARGWARPNGATCSTPNMRSTPMPAAGPTPATGGRSASACRPPRRSSNPIISPPATAAGTAAGRAPTMRSMSFRPR